MPRQDMTSTLAAWLTDLEARHLATLTISEVARALSALSAAYVERRGRLVSKGSFDTLGKRAAYAIYYAPLHFITTSEIVAALGAQEPLDVLLDLGCGTGAAGAAWATSLAQAPKVLGVDTHPWALEEAERTYRACGLDGSTRRIHASRLIVPRHVDAIVAGWVLNELDIDARDALQRILIAATRAGRRLLVVEPIATRITPWWNTWAAPFVADGARTDEWRLSVEIPDLVRRLGRAAGLNPETLTARSLYVGGS